MWNRGKEKSSFSKHRKKWFFFLSISFSLSSSFPFIKFPRRYYEKKWQKSFYFIPCLSCFLMDFHKTFSAPVEWVKKRERENENEKGKQKRFTMKHFYWYYPNKECLVEWKRERKCGGRMSQSVGRGFMEKNKYFIPLSVHFHGDTQWRRMMDLSS